MTASRNRILIAGIGNIFQGDDAFGSEVARKLVGRTWPEGVLVVDFGIRGIDLVYELIQCYEMTILIDATRQGGPPGTLYTIEPDLSELCNANECSTLIDSHVMDPLRVLKTVYAMGGSCEHIVLVGCEPADLGGEEGLMGLSEPVVAAIEPACKMVRLLVEEFLQLRSGTLTETDSAFQLIGTSREPNATASHSCINATRKSDPL